MSEPLLLQGNSASIENTIESFDEYTEGSDIVGSSSPILQSRNSTTEENIQQPPSSVQATSTGSAKGENVDECTQTSDVIGSNISREENRAQSNANEDDSYSSLLTPGGDPDPTKNINRAFFNLVKSIHQRFSSSILGWPTAFFIMISMSYGSAVLILPFTVQQLGIVIWLLFTIACFVILCFCGVLLKESCAQHLTNNKEICKTLVIQQPYPTLAELTVGKRFANLLQCTLYVCLAAEILAFMLLSATTLNSLVLLWMPYYTRIRIWLVICYIVTLPFFMKRTFSDLVSPAVIAVTTSIVATVCILVICLVAKLHYGVNVKKYVTASTGSRTHMFKMFGEIMFAASGPALLIPNIMVLMRKPETFHVPIIWSHTVVFTFYSLIAIIPYYVFGTQSRSSVIDTLHDAIKKLNMSPYWLSVLTVAEVVLAIHFTMVAVLSANPVFLSLEHKLDISSEFGPKRFLLRSTIILVLLVFTIALPFFQPVIAIIGAVPLVLLCIVYPIIIYWKSFKMTAYMKVVLSIILLLTVTCMVGAVVYSIIDIVEYFYPVGGLKV